MHRGADALLDRNAHDPGETERGRIPAEVGRSRLADVSPAEDEREARARLILQLAADRLREMRDDGVTLAYVARMYDVPAGVMERLYGDLIPSRPR